MARIYAGSGSSGPITKLEDLVVYPARIAGFKLGPEQTFVDDKGVPKTDQPLIVSLQLSSDPEDVLDRFLSIRYGENKSTGAVSQFRRFLNAVAGKPERERIEWFDPDTGEFCYAGNEIHTLKAGDAVKFAGTNEQSKTDNSKQVFKVMKWIPAARAAVAPSTKPETPAAFPQTLPDRTHEADASEVPW